VEGVLYAIDNKGNVLWTKPSYIPTENSAVIGADGTVYFAGGAFKPNGTVLWQACPYSIGWGWWGNTIGADGTLFSAGNGSIGNVITAINRANGMQAWYSPTFAFLNASPPLIDADGVLFGGGSGTANGVYVATSSEVSPVPLSYVDTGMGGAFDAPSPGLDGSLYVPTTNGIFAFAPP
jgi:hypothetical protein